MLEPHSSELQKEAVTPKTPEVIGTWIAGLKDVMLWMLNYTVWFRWARGATLAEGQNIARRLMEAPANILTPTNFAQVSAACVGLCIRL